MTKTVSRGLIEKTLCSEALLILRSGNSLAIQLRGVHLSPVVVQIRQDCSSSSKMLNHELWFRPLTQTTDPSLAHLLQCVGQTNATSSRSPMPVVILTSTRCAVLHFTRYPEMITHREKSAAFYTPVVWVSTIEAFLTVRERSMSTTLQPWGNPA